MSCSPLDTEGSPTCIDLAYTSAYKQFVTYFKVIAPYLPAIESAHNSTLSMRIKHLYEVEAHIPLTPKSEASPTASPARKSPTLTTEVTYMTEDEAKKHIVTFNEDGKPTREGVVIDFMKEQADGKSGSMLWVIGIDRTCYFFSNGGDIKHAHSSIVKGGHVLGAGEVSGTSDGTITGINNKSGHYRPGESYLTRSVEILRECGAVIPDEGIVFVIKKGQRETT